MSYDDIDVSYDDIIVFVGTSVYNDNVVVLPVQENLARGDWPVEAYTDRFYEYLDDEFDFLMFIPTLPSGKGAGRSFFIRVSNDVQGIGVPSFSDTRRYGSAGKLQGIIVSGNYSIYQDRGLSIVAEGPTLHELMHRWANFIVSPGRSDAHWGFSSANGNIGGFDVGDLVDYGNGRYSAGHFDVAGAADNVDTYSSLELYLVGLVSAQEVPDLWVAEDGEWLRDDTGVIIRAANGDPMFSATQVRTYTIEDIVAEHGERVPNVIQSQKNFRAAVILLVDQDHPATREMLETLSKDVSWFSHPGDDSIHRYDFYEATGGRATITMDGLSQFKREP